ncbi:hypothetical protein SAMN04489726_6236 [Allokutzneria albata]|uniref:Uncharacterized protein n=1 Tax=Allokutzneria albata TaxID=211114 RepID=A0A1H0ARG8_ALLAB|nr:hypothetical protein SAMN04489726_6236 [Allokutzneria albata]
MTRQEGRPIRTLRELLAAEARPRRERSHTEFPCFRTAERARDIVVRGLAALRQQGETG